MHRHRANNQQCRRLDLGNLSDGLAIVTHDHENDGRPARSPLRHSMKLKMLRGYCPRAYFYSTLRSWPI